MFKDRYDVIIIGGGPAGYTAALYGARAGMDTLIIEKMYAGGQMAQASVIDNYPGFEDGIDGYMLGSKMQNHAVKYGATILNEEVIDVELDGVKKLIKTQNREIRGKNIIIATGAKHKELGLENELEYKGKGIHYCATCDGAFYKNKVALVVGGGNTAVADALYLARLCKKVIIVHRRDVFRATKIYYKQLEKNSNIEVKMNTEVKKIIIADNKLKGVEIINNKTHQFENIDIDGLFISIGIKPNTELFKNKVELDDEGYVVAEENTRTNINGVYAVGDVRTKGVRQVVTAVSDGAVAICEIERKLLKNVVE